jgi:hypothetical protein
VTGTAYQTGDRLIVKISPRHDPDLQGRAGTVISTNPGDIKHSPELMLSVLLDGQEKPVCFYAWRFEKQTEAGATGF